MTELHACRSPLVEIAIAMMTESGQHFDFHQLAQVRTLLQNYLAGQVAFPSCLGALTPFLGGPQAVQKLETILRTPETPIFAYLQAMPRTSKTRPWSPYEDQRLLAALHRFGLQDWSAVAQFVGNDRTKSQCNQRWGRGLDPKIRKDQWSPEQDRQLLELVAFHGEGNWMRIAGDLGSRCDVQCRYRYKQLQKRDDFDEQLAIAKRSTKPSSNPPSRPRTKPRPQIPYPGLPPPPSIPPIHTFFQPPVPIPQTVSNPNRTFSMLGVETRIVPPVVQLVQQPVTFAPPKNEIRGVQRVARQPSIGFSDADAGDISAQGSGLEWKAQFGSSDSALFFGISPVNSFKFR
jgi:hypothetical protein